MRNLRFLFACTLICGLVPNANAQETRGSITGRVVDSSGGVVSNASITATNAGTNISATTTTNSDGAYEILFLLPGQYTVIAEASGFKKTVQPVEVRIHERNRVDFALEVGAVTEEINVTAQASLLQTANANLGQVLDSRNLSELPIEYGTPYAALFFINGVADNGSGRQYPDQNNMDVQGQQMQVNGTPRGTTAWTVDGTTNEQMTHFLGPAFAPPVDLVADMKVETAFDASVGNTSGLVINVALKSGTNTPHGTAYGFFQSPSWTANQWLNNKQGVAKPDFSYKRWGATLTGPVYIPKLYNGHDRTFFTFGYEADQELSPAGSILSVPTAQNLTGDFSNLLALGPQYQIYDPATIQSAGNGRFSRQPFPGNVIPSSRINPIALKILSHYPKPNQAGRADGFNNYASPWAQPDDIWDYTARIDHNISDKQRLFGRMTFGRRPTGPYRGYWNDIAVGENFISTAKQFALDYVDVLTATTVLNIKLGYSRSTGGHLPDRVGFDVSQLGFPASTAQQLQSTYSAFPGISVAGLTSIGTESHDYGTAGVYDFAAGLNKQQGSHGWKAGVEIIQYRINYATFAGGYDAAGRFNFNAVYTNGPLDNSPTSPNGVGQGLAALLLGLPDSGGISRVANQANLATTYALYLHDNWRVSGKLTLDLGLRWEYYGPQSERYNRSVRGFNPTATLPITAPAIAQYASNPDPALPVSQFKPQGGLLFAGLGGVPSSFWEGSKLGFAPRFGFAYQARQRVVLRGGFGIFPFSRAINPDQASQTFGVQTGFSQDTPLVPTVNNGQTFIANLTNPFPGGILAPPGASLGPATFLGQAIKFYNTNSILPYTMQWNVNTQMMLPANFLLEVGYTGTRSIRLPLSRSLHAIPDQYLSTSPVRDQNTINFLTAQVPNPFAGLLPGTSLNASTIARSQLLAPYPQFTGVTLMDYQGWSWYNALQVRLERRFSKGFTILAGYTFSKNIDATTYQNAGDPLPTRAIAALDRPQQISLTGMWELPFGKGRPLLAQAGRLLDSVVGGWQLAAVWQINSGYPMSFGDALLKPGMSLADIPLPSSQRTVDHWFNTAAFVTNQSQQLANNLQTFPVRLAGVRTGAYNSADISLLKNITVYERHHFQFRAEAYNAFNHPSAYDAPVTTPTSSAFGQMTYMYYLPRAIQLGIKYLF